MSSTPMITAEPATLTHQQWVELAQALNIQTELFIDGKYVPSQSGERFDSVNPATGEVIASMACGNKDDINLAVESSKAAWEDGRWRHMPPRDRIAVLQRFADLVDAHAGELALLETLDMGKPITDALTIDLPETKGM